MTDLEYVMVMHDGSKSTKFMSEDYCKDLMEQLAAAQSQEVCTVAHDNVETCGYCQRDVLAARLAEATQKHAECIDYYEKKLCEVEARLAAIEEVMLRWNSDANYTDQNAVYAIDALTLEGAALSAKVTP